MDPRERHIREDKPDLIPTLKTVEREGKRHTQTYWVLPADVMNRVEKDGVNAALTDLVGADMVDEVRHMASSWRTSPGSPGAARFRGAASALAFQKPEVSAEVLDAIHEEKEDVLLAAEYHLADDWGRYIQDGDRAEAEVKFPKSATPSFGATMERDKQIEEYLRPRIVERMRTAIGDEFRRGNMLKDTIGGVTALAAVSQSFYIKEPTVTVFRGIKAEQAQQIRAAVDRGEKEVGFDCGVLTSFTEDRDVAARFAGGSGVIVKQEIPRSSIIMSWRARQYQEEGRGLLDEMLGRGEKEVVVLTKGAMKVPAEAIIPREKVETWYDKALAKQEEKVEGV